ncbi:MAG: cell division protein ZapA [Gemmatimonadetes bacterium]|nr:cell division protein ZapA [Gemmatimonadota bacterium]
MSPEARTTSVHILGQEYKIRSTEEAAFVREVALYVDEVMHRISSKMTTGTTSQIAVLAALNIAEELFRDRRDGRDADDPEVDDRMRALLERMDTLVSTAAAEESGTPTPSSR